MRALVILTCLLASSGAWALSYEDNKKSVNDKYIKKNEKTDIRFLSQELPTIEWSKKLIGNFHLTDALLYFGEKKVKINESMISQKRLAEFMTLQVHSVVLLEQAPFIKLPPGLTGARTFHLTLTIPNALIKGLKF